MHLMAYHIWRPSGGGKHPNMGSLAKGQPGGTSGPVQRRRPLCGTPCEQHLRTMEVVEVLTKGPQGCGTPGGRVSCGHLMPKLTYRHLHSPRITSPTGDDNHYPHYINVAEHKPPLETHRTSLDEYASNRSFGADTDFTSSPPSSHGHTFSSPIMDPTGNVRLGHCNSDISEITHDAPLTCIYRLWPLAPQVFGPLLQDPDFPALIDQWTTRPDVSEDTWNEICTFIDDNPEILDFISFRYRRESHTLLVMSARALHEVVNVAMLHASEWANIAVDPRQRILIDCNRLVADEESRQIPDGIVGIQYSNDIPHTPGALPVMAEEEDAGEDNAEEADAEAEEEEEEERPRRGGGGVRGWGHGARDTQTVEEMVGELRKAMVEADGEDNKHGGPVLFIGIKVQEFKYMDPACPAQRRWVRPRCSHANDILCTGFKRKGKQLIGRITATLFIFLLTNLLRVCDIHDNAEPNKVNPYIEAGLATPVLHSYTIPNLMPKGVDHSSPDYEGQDGVCLALPDEVVRHATEVVAVERHLNLPMDVTVPIAPIHYPTSSKFRWSIKMEPTGLQGMVQYLHGVNMALKRVLPVDGNPDAPAPMAEDIDCVAEFAKRRHLVTPPPRPKPTPKERETRTTKADDLYAEEHAPHEEFKSCAVPSNMVIGRTTRTRQMEHQCPQRIAPYLPSHAQHTINAAMFMSEEECSRLIELLSCIVCLPRKTAEPKSKSPASHKPYKHMSSQSRLGHSSSTCSPVMEDGTARHLEAQCPNLESEQDRGQQTCSDNVESLYTMTHAMIRVKLTVLASEATGELTLPHVSDPYLRGTRSQAHPQLVTPVDAPAAPPMPPCPRGAIKFKICQSAPAPVELPWDNDPLSAPSHASKGSVKTFFSDLTVNLTDSAIVQCCENVLRGAESVLMPGSIPEAGASLSTLTECCAEVFHEHEATDFAVMVQNTAKKMCSLKTLEKWNAMGCKFAQVAGGGTMYVLILIVLRNLRGKLGSMDGHTSRYIGNLLRWPDGTSSLSDVCIAVLKGVDSPAGQAVKNTIIPAVALLQKRCPFPMETFLPVTCMLPAGEAKNTLCGNLKISDLFFDSFVYK
ncbi:uncharacterized protein B0H18DRAFT_960044 [Fomitopsis serialis]|uniref:uncharacterized protein n=1 Tax=Fomitopsis serialis TaxID=139415 RepID=UPI0020088E2D|nr:uncharacterized protein B0H18DRAFT_960044 [Neoantrodia serialis]KAH9914039.1 hypothetical protein B0H18DRAFT_960044 [Neoantrodia serialis]